ncbi:MAG TPA: hypothetical protein VJ276_03250 [Thermoanaerobaculia bacterium]|nr:hypothetical protein [Thermoanaerobaculia bacterium]
MSGVAAAGPDFHDFWRPEYLNAFRIMMQRQRTSKPALLGALRCIPPMRARVDHWNDIEGDDRLIVLFTHNYDNPGARANEAWLMAILAETRALTWFGSEAASGPFDFTPYRAFPDRSINAAIARHFLSEFMIGPLEYAALVVREPIFVWGIEDKDLYLAALEAHKTNSPSYWSIIERRPPVLLRNLLDKMQEMDVRVAGCWLTQYNFDRLHSLLREQGIPHVGIRALDQGASDYGRTDKQIRGEKWDEEEGFVQDLMLGKLEGFSGWLRSLRRPRTAGPWSMNVRGQPSQVMILKEYGVERALRAARARVRRFLRWFKPSATMLSGMAEDLGIPLVDRTCDECSARFKAPQRPLAFPLALEPRTTLDLGGYCGKCRRMLCSKHVAPVAIQPSEAHGWLCFAGCPVCSTPLVADEHS